MYNLCKAFQCFPEAGGLLQQPSIYMDYFLVIENQFNEENKTKSEEGNAKSFAAQIGRGKHG